MIFKLYIMKDKNALLCLGIISLGVIFNAVGISSIKKTYKTLIVV